MATLLSLWGSRALSWGIGPGVRMVAIGAAILVALTWFRLSIGSGIKARFEAAQAREIARVTRQQAARHRAIEDALERDRDKDRQRAEKAEATETELRSRITQMLLAVQTNKHCRLSTALRKERNK